MMKNGVKSPCYKCPDREKGCHSWCEKWEDFEREKKKEDEVIRKNREKERVYRDYRIRKG